MAGRKASARAGSTPQSTSFSCSLVGSRVEAAHRDAPHWYLVVMSVRPERQRQELGKALVIPILERADPEGVDCRLETADPTNIPFYQGLGFNVVDTAFAPIPRGPSLTMFHRSLPRP